MSSGALTAKLLGPVVTSLDIFNADGRSGALDGFDEILEHKRWLEELVGIDFGPAHFHGAFVSWRAGREFLDTIVHHLLERLACGDCTWIGNAFDAHLFVVSCCLDLSHGLHESILHRYGDVTPRIALAQGSQGLEIARLQLTGSVAYRHFKHFHTAGLIRKTDVDSALESTTDSGV